jgi:hypothetical protein
MAVAKDATKGSVGVTTGQGANIAVGITVGASATLLLLIISSDGSSAPTTLGARWDPLSTNQTFVSCGTPIQSTVGGSTAIMGILGIVNPTPGAKTVTFSCSNNGGVYYTLISFTGSVTSSVAAATEGYATNSGTSASCTVTTSASIPSGDMATGGTNNTNGFSGFPSDGGTSLGSNTAQTTNMAAEYYSGAGSTITQTISQGSSGTFQSVIVGIKAAGAAITTIGWLPQWEAPQRPVSWFDKNQTSAFSESAQFPQVVYEPSLWPRFDDPIHIFEHREFIPAAFLTEAAPFPQVVYEPSLWPRMEEPPARVLYPTANQPFLAYPEGLPSFPITYFRGDWPDFARGVGYLTSEQPFLSYTNALPSLHVTHFEADYPDFARGPIGQMTANQRSSEFQFTPAPVTFTFFASYYPDKVDQKPGLQASEHPFLAYTNALPSLQVTHFEADYPDFARGPVGLPAPEQWAAVFATELPALQVTYFKGDWPDFARAVVGLSTAAQLPWMGSSLPALPVTFFQGSYPDQILTPKYPTQYESNLFASWLPSLLVTTFQTVYPDILYPAAGLHVSQQQAAAYIRVPPVVLVTYFAADYPDFAYPRAGLSSALQAVTEFQLPIIPPPVPKLVETQIPDMMYTAKLYAAFGPYFFATEKNIPPQVTNKQLYTQGGVSTTAPNIWKGRS